MENFPITVLNILKERGKVSNLIVDKENESIVFKFLRNKTNTPLFIHLKAPSTFEVLNTKTINPVDLLNN